jgi:hypothetical protein
MPSAFRLPQPAAQASELAGDDGSAGFSGRRTVRMRGRNPEMPVAGAYRNYTWELHDYGNRDVRNDFGYRHGEPDCRIGARNYFSAGELRHATFLELLHLNW